MITEDYVSFETAKLLKEKGFDGICDTAYEKITSKHSVEEAAFSDWGKLNQVKRPTLQMAIKWLREKQIFITIGFCDYPILHKSEWIPEVYTHDSIFDEPSIAYSTYEEACEAAIKYCLENLI